MSCNDLGCRPCASRTQLDRVYNASIPSSRRLTVMTLGRLVRRGFGAILVLALAASVYTFAQSSSTPPSSGPVDPGVRTGPPSVGGSLSGLTADETAFFQDGRARFADIEVVTGGANNGLGPRFNSTRSRPQAARAPRGIR